MLAGQHKVIDNDSLQVFVSKEGLRFGAKWAFNQDYAKFPNTFRAAFRYYPRFDEELDDYTTVCIVNGEATTVRMPEITFKFTLNSYGYPSVSVDDAPNIYPDVKTAYAYHDYTVNNGNGVKQTPSK